MSLPAAERLELYLQLGGRQEFAVLERSATDPEGLKLAARELAEASRIKVRRSCSSGKVFLEAAETLDRPGRDALEKGLLKIMARGEVEVPKGTRLARRVAATKAVLTKAAEAGAALQASKAPAA